MYLHTIKMRIFYIAIDEPMGVDSRFSLLSGTKSNEIKFGA